MTSKRVGSGRRKRRPRWRLALGALVALIVVSALFGDEGSDEQAATTTTQAQTQTESSASESAPGEAAEGSTGATGAGAETIQDARDLVDDDDYPAALVLAAALGGNAERDIGRRISNRIGRRVSAAVRRGNRGGARRLLATASDYQTTKSITTARVQLRSATQRASARRAAALSARRQERAAAVERERQAEEAAAAQEAEEGTPDDSSTPSESVGEGTCAEVGVKDFPVGPGDERDADGDGIACES